MKILKNYSFLMPISLSLIFFSSIVGQEGWYWQNPLPQGNNLHDVFFPFSNIGWAVGDHGTILYSDDGGTSWIPQNSGTKNPLYSVHFTDAYNGWALGSYRTILHTTDGGETWEPQDSGLSGILHLYSVFFIDNLNGWAAGMNETIIHTDDGGTSWSTQITGGTAHFNSIYFSDASHGWAGASAGSNGIIWHTSNGGDTWTKQLIPANPVKSVMFIDDNAGWAVGDNGMIFHTSNGGSEWTPQSSDTSNDLHSVYFKDVNKGWAVGESGLILYTSNGGGNWSPENSGTSNNLNSIYAPDFSSGAWIVGHAGTTLHIPQSGVPWVLQSSGVTKELWGSFFMEGEENWIGWAVGESGTIIHSDDAGNSWTQQNSNTSNTFYSVFFVHTKVGCAVGRHATIARTAIAGESWGIKQLQMSHHFFSVFFNVYGWIAGERGRILHSDDFFDTYTTQHSDDSYHLYDIHLSDPFSGWAVGEIGVLLNTTNGLSWTKFEHPRPAEAKFNSVHSIDVNTMWAVGLKGMIYHRTSDGNWIEQESGTSDRLNSVYFTDANNGWAVGAQGTVLHTRDGGNSWVMQNSGTSNELHEVFFVDPATGWIVGQNGTVLHTINGGGNSSTDEHKRSNLDKAILDQHSTLDTLIINLLGKQSQNSILASVEVLIDSVIHTSTGDLEFTLTHNDISDTLIFHAGGDGDNFIGTQLTDAAIISISDTVAPFTGRFKPYNLLSKFAGLDPNGEWVLRIYDSSLGNTGTLEAWGLKFFYDVTTGIHPVRYPFPKEFKLQQNYPNPFNPITTISFSLPKAGEVNLNIYNILGEKIQTLVKKMLPAGQHYYQWDANQFASGIYIYVLQTKHSQEAKKMILMK